MAQSGESRQLTEREWVAGIAPAARPGDLAYDIAVALMPPSPDSPECWECPHDEWHGGVVTGPPYIIREGDCQFVTAISLRALGARREPSTKFDDATREELLARLDEFDRVRAQGAADVRHLY